MSIDVRHTRGAAITGGGPTQDILVNSTNGLTPKAVMFIFNQGTVTSTEAAHCQLCVGFSDGTNHRSGLYSCEDNVSTTNTWSKALNDRAIFSINANTGTLEGHATCAFITNGVRLTWSAYPSAAFFIEVIFFFGEGISVSIGDFDASSDTSKTTGFPPELVFAFGSSIAAFTTSGTTTSTAEAQFSLGYLAGGSQSSISMYESDNLNLLSSNSNATSILGSIYIYEDPLIGFVAQITPTSTGFSISGDSGFIGYMAISFNGQARSEIVQFATPTSTGSVDVNTSFNPIFALELQSVLTAYDIGETAIHGATLGVGIFSNSDAAKSHSTANRCHGLQLFGTTGLSRQAVSATRLTEPGGSYTLIASFTSFGVLKYTKNFTAVDATARKGFALVISEPVIIDFLNDPQMPVEDCEVISYG